MISRSEGASPGVAAAPSDHRREAGFTLIEVIITLTILGLALTLITGYRPPWSGALSIRGTAAELVSGLRFARSEAISQGRPVAFEVDLAAHRYRVGHAAPRPLPPKLAIVLLTVIGERLSNATGAIRFNSDGSSSGGRISIGDGSRTIIVGVDWLSGRVSVADAR